MIILREVKEGERQVPYEVPCTWNLKDNASQHIYETKTDSEKQRTDLWLSRGREGGLIWKMEVIIACALWGCGMHIK